jgi:pSer/pThr/pTyr-binding forkhead associated (FHA) protein
VGRATESDALIDDKANVSRRHAHLHWRGDHLAIENLDSTCGIFLDGGS